MSFGGWFTLPQADPLPITPDPHVEKRFYTIMSSSVFPVIGFLILFLGRFDKPTNLNVGISNSITLEPSSSPLPTAATSNTLLFGFLLMCLCLAFSWYCALMQESIRNSRLGQGKYTMGVVSFMILVGLTILTTVAAPVPWVGLTLSCLSVGWAWLIELGLGLEASISLTATMGSMALYFVSRLETKHKWTFLLLPSVEVLILTFITQKYESWYYPSEAPPTPAALANTTVDAARDAVPLMAEAYYRAAESRSEANNAVAGANAAMTTASDAIGVIDRLEAVANQVNAALTKLDSAVKEALTKFDSAVKEAVDGVSMAVGGVNANRATLRQAVNAALQMVSNFRDRANTVNNSALNLVTSTGTARTATATAQTSLIRVKRALESAAAAAGVVDEAPIVVAVQQNVPQHEMQIAGERVPPAPIVGGVQEIVP